MLANRGFLACKLRVSISTILGKSSFIGILVNEGHERVRHPVLSIIVGSSYGASSVASA